MNDIFDYILLDTMNRSKIEDYKFVGTADSLSSNIRISFDLEDVQPWDTGSRNSKYRKTIRNTTSNRTVQENKTLRGSLATLKNNAASFSRCRWKGLKTESSSKELTRQPSANRNLSKCPTSQSDLKQKQFRLAKSL